MIGTVMMWASMILIGMLALGSFGCCVLMLLGVILQRKDRDMALMFGLMLLLSAGICTGLVFAVIAMGRNLV